MSGAARPGLALTPARLREMRDATAPWTNSVSFRQAGRPFLPESKGYNRWDDPALHAKIPELRQMSAFVMRHRLGGGRVELLVDGGILCKRCFQVFATLLGGTRDWSSIQPCPEGAAQRDSKDLHAARTTARASENLASLQQWLLENGS